MQFRRMTPEKFYNVLCNLNNMESLFLAQHPEQEVYDKIATYTSFLENYFIQKNKLVKLYYLVTDELEEEGSYYEDVSGIGQLAEISQIALGLDIMLTKQFNFPCQGLHKGSCFECIYVMQGTAVFTQVDREYRLQEGDFFFHSEEEAYALSPEEDSIVLNIDFRKSYLYREYPRLFTHCRQALNFFDRCLAGETQKNYLLFHTDNQEELKTLVLQMFLEGLCREPFGNEMICHYFALLVTCLKRYASGRIETAKAISMVERYYDEILLYIEKHYQQVTLEEAAREIHFSKQYVARIVHKMTGDSFSRLVRRVRIQKACEYLRETSLSIEKITELVGFSSNSYFWRAFVGEKGMSPSEYRQKEQRSFH